MVMENMEGNVSRKNGPTELASDTVTVIMQNREYYRNRSSGGVVKNGTTTGTNYGRK